VQVLGNSLGARVAMELAARGRARSVVAIAPSGLNNLVERCYQGLLIGGARFAARWIRRFIPAMARNVVGRSALMAGLRAKPWRAGELEARALQQGFAGAEAFWRMLWWAVLTDKATGLDRIEYPPLPCRCAYRPVRAPAEGRPRPPLRRTRRDRRARPRCHRGSGETSSHERAAPVDWCAAAAPGADDLPHSRQDVPAAA
jgi:pimeloyl-ACP methyl ester carboxylesterase